MTSSERAAFRAALGTKFDYSALIECAWVLSKNYEFLQFSYLTESIMGRAIPMFRVGEGAKEFYYIGAHHGAEGITGRAAYAVSRGACRIGGAARNTDGRQFGLYSSEQEFIFRAGAECGRRRYCRQRCIQG